MIQAYEALEVLEEFVNDIDAAGLATAEETWPDLVITYESAKDVLCRAGWIDEHGNKIGA